MKIKLILNAALFLTLLTLGTASVRAQEAFPYSNDFSAAGLPNTAGPWALDTGNTVLNYVQPTGSSTVVGTATEEVSGVAGNDFVLSTWFTVNDVQGISTAITVGFGALSNTGALGNYYLVDWAFGGSGTGAVRILRQGGGGLTSSSGGNAGLPDIDETYELRLTGQYDGGTLQMTFAVFDVLGNQLGTAATATDAAPLTGSFFGNRNRTANASHALDLTYHGISVGEEPMPRPSSVPVPVFVEITNLFPEPNATFHPAAEGLGFTVSTDPANTIDPEDIELYLNDERVLHGDLDITVISSSEVDVFYDQLEANLVYMAEVVASDESGEKSVSWSFNTFDGVSHEDYVNDFFWEGFPFLSFNDWRLDTGKGVHGLTIGGGTVNRFGTVDLPEWVGSDFVASTWFEVNEAEGGGGSPASMGHVVLASTTSGGNYYLGYWGLAGGGQGINGELVLLRTGGGNGNLVIQGSNGVATKPAPGELRELRLTGTYEDGTLTMVLAVYNESGVQVGGSTVGVDQSPLTNPFFGVRSRTAGNDHLLNIDHYRYSLTAEALPAPHPVLLEFTGVNPAPNTSFHPLAEGLSLNVSTDPGRVLQSSDIDLYLNGELVSPSEVTITGASPSFNVAFSNLEANRFYTARVFATDNLSPGGLTWSFDTMEGFQVQVDEDLSLNQSIDDVLQGLLGTSGTGALEGSLASLTDAISTTGPVANVIPGADDTPVAISWDLGSPDSASYRSLTRVDIWVSGGDPWRTGFDGEFAISNDGVNFTAIPGSRFATALTYTGATMEIGGVEIVGTGSGNPNLVRYFIPPEVEGFRYLRWISHGYDNLGEGILRQPRIVEIDGFVASGAPHIALIEPLNGAFFYSAGDGLTFEATTDAGKTIGESDIQLFLNGNAVAPEALDITGSATAREVFYDGLVSGQFYTATAIVWDGERETTHIWDFDTLNEAETIMIEAEDYNFGDTLVTATCPVTKPATGGSYWNDPDPSTFISGTGYVPSDRTNTYVDRIGAPGIDFHSTATVFGDANDNLYRFCDVVGTNESTDILRSKYLNAGIPDYQLHRVRSGEWFNYTRDFPAGDYRILLRASAVGSPVMRLERVTSDPTATGQTTEVLGEFLPDASGDVYTFTPLTHSSGLADQQVSVSLSGEETLRLTAVSANSFNNIVIPNFIALVPATTTPPSVASVTPPPNSGNVARNAEIKAELLHGDSDLDLGSIKLFVNDIEAPASVGQTLGGANVTYTPGNLSFRRNTARVEFDDLAGSGPYSVQWSFSVLPSQLGIFSALQFNGTSDYVDITSVGGTFGDFTVSGWFYLMEQPGGQALYRLTNEESITRSIEIRELNGVLTAGVRVFGGTGDPLHTVTSGDFQYEEWVHIAFVRDGGDLRLYLDGELKGSGTAPDTEILVQGRSFLGANPFPWDQPGADFFRGAIDEFQIWKVARTQQEIQDSMFEPLHDLVVADDGLYARFGFNEGSGTEAFDFSSINGFVVTVNVTWVESEIFESVEPPDLPSLSIARDGANIVLTWDGEAQLETASELTGPWTVVEGAASPHPVDPSLNPRQFFRLVVAN